MKPHFRSPPRLSVVVLTLALAAAAGAVFSACAGLGMVGGIADAAMGAIHKSFMSTTEKNYGDQYKDQFDQVFGALTKSVSGQVTKLKEADAAAAHPADAKPADGATTSAPVTSTTNTAGGSPAATTTTTTSPPASDAPLALTVSLMKAAAGGAISLPVNDGDIVFDGFGTHGDGDNLKLSFSANMPSYVYVISVDSTGWLQTIFPNAENSSARNPVQAGNVHQIPEGALWFPLDNHRGLEHLFFLASKTPRTDVEGALAKIGTQPRPPTPEHAELVASAAPITRGLGAPRQVGLAGVQNQGGATFTAPAEIFSGAPGNGDVLMTRWFKHE